MTTTILSREELPIAHEEDVMIVRRRVRTIAQERGFDSFASAALTTATSELTRNAWMHGGGGTAVIELLSDDVRFGVRIIFKDQGPGIADVERVMAGGYSTARSMGLGLSGSKRLVDDFTLETTVGKGTTITVVKWTPF